MSVETGLKPVSTTSGFITAVLFLDYYGIYYYESIFKKQSITTII
jgi:hypothetical protein